MAVFRAELRRISRVPALAWMVRRIAIVQENQGFPESRALRVDFESQAAS
jgi:hypothetical protein